MWARPRLGEGCFRACMRRLTEPGGFDVGDQLLMQGTRGREGTGRVAAGDLFAHPGSPDLLCRGVDGPLVGRLVWLWADGGWPKERVGTSPGSVRT